MKTGQAASSRGPYARTRALREVIEDIVLREFAAIPMSTRQVYYQVVSRGVLANCDSSYEKVQRLVVDMRRDGTIPYSRIVDRTRRKYKLAAWEGPRAAMEAVACQYRRDVWDEQRTIVMVGCEKQALEGVFASAVDQYGASLWVVRGYVSDGFAFEWAEEIKEHYLGGHNVVIAYFGDHDPDGMCIEKKIQERLNEHGAIYSWHRHGLLLGDLRTFGLVNLGVKPTSSRAKKYVERYGDVAAELDALRPDELHRRICAAISEHVDGDALARIRAVEEAERESLDLVAANWDLAVQAAAGAA